MLAVGDSGYATSLGQYDTRTQEERFGERTSETFKSL